MEVDHYSNRHHQSVENSRISRNKNKNKSFIRAGLNVLSSNNNTSRQKFNLSKNQQNKQRIMTKINSYMDIITNRSTRNDIYKNNNIIQGNCKKNCISNYQQTESNSIMNNNNNNLITINKNFVQNRFPAFENNNPYLNNNQNGNAGEEPNNLNNNNLNDVNNNKSINIENKNNKKNNYLNKFNKCSCDNNNIRNFDGTLIHNDNNFSIKRYNANPNIISCLGRSMKKNANIDKEVFNGYILAQKIEREETKNDFVDKTIVGREKYDQRVRNVFKNKCDLNKNNPPY